MEWLLGPISIEEGGAVMEKRTEHQSEHEKFDYETPITYYNVRVRVCVLCSVRVLCACVLCLCCAALAAHFFFTF